MSAFGRIDRELVATDAERPVAATDRVHDDAAQAREELVALRVALLVVDLLEVVDIHKQETQVRAVTRGVLELPAQLLLEGPVVAEAGEGVEERVLARLPVEVDEPGAFLLEALRIAQDRVDEPGHDQWQDDGAAGEDEDGHPAA